MPCRLFNGGMSDGQHLLTESEAAEVLRLTPRQVVKLAKAGELPTVHLPGNELRFDPADLSAFVESCKRPADRRQEPAP